MSQLPLAPRPAAALNHLLTIGYDADDQGTFAYFTGMLLQIFSCTEETPPEQALVGRLLDFPVASGAAPAYRAQLAGLQVVAHCACGCPSLFFATPPGAKADVIEALSRPVNLRRSLPRPGIAWM